MTNDTKKPDDVSIAFGLSELDMVLIIGALRTHAIVARELGALKDAQLTERLGKRLRDMMALAVDADELNDGATVN